MTDIFTSPPAAAVEAALRKVGAHQNGTTVIAAYHPIIVRAVVEACMKAVEAEPELPGDMPDEMWEAIRNDRDAVQEAGRIVVRLTKKGIAARIVALLPPDTNEEMNMDAEFVMLVEDVAGLVYPPFRGWQEWKRMRQERLAALWQYVQRREARARAEGEAMRGALERCADAWHSAHLGFENGPCRCPAHEIALAALPVPDETRQGRHG